MIHLCPQELLGVAPLVPLVWQLLRGVVRWVLL